ncbi:hypothetical protein [Mycobacterium uberis]|uniref:hypothetical protein n=1 Tax=Mycobacterium uberis TaxID=2162698 RepID=UPI000E306007|nr:hypothetical protein [Mycobacterium uberis]
MPAGGIADTDDDTWKRVAQASRRDTRLGPRCVEYDTVRFIVASVVQATHLDPGVALTASTTPAKYLAKSAPGFFA